MSKAALRKELASFDAGQLRQIILSAYDSSPEAKAYFEFFLNPDTDAFISQLSDELFKEIKRSKYGYSKARVSELRRIVKRVTSYGLAPEHVMRVMLNAVSLLVSAERFLNYTDTQLRGTQKFVADYIAYADSHNMAATALANINGIADNEKTGTRAMRRLVRDAAVAAVESIKGGGK